MCKRVCDKCSSEEHLMLYGICGTTIVCANNDCSRVFEFQFDEQACPISVMQEGDDAVNKYVEERSYINVNEKL